MQDNSALTPEEETPDVSETTDPDTEGDLSIDIALEQIFDTLNKLEMLFTAKIDRSEYELEALKKQSEEIQEYKADLYASILTPVLKPLTRTHALMKRAIAKANADQVDSISLAEFEFAFDDLTEVLEDSGVEVRSFKEGSPFEANFVKITGQNKVVEPEKNKTVNSTSSDAYVFKGSVLEKAHAIVNVYSDEAAPASQDDQCLC